MATIRGSYPQEKYKKIKDSQDKYDQECIRLNELLIQWYEEKTICEKKLFNNPLCRSVTMQRLEELAPLHATSLEENWAQTHSEKPKKIPLFMIYSQWERNSDLLSIDISTIELLKSYKNGIIDVQSLERLASRNFYTSQPDWLVKELDIVQAELVEVIKQEKAKQERQAVSKHLQDWLTGIRDKGYRITEEEKALLEEMGVIINPEKLEGNRKER